MSQGTICEPISMFILRRLLCNLYLVHRKVSLDHRLDSILAGNIATLLRFLLGPATSLDSVVSDGEGTIHNSHQAVGLVSGEACGNHLSHITRITARVATKRSRIITVRTGIATTKVTHLIGAGREGTELADGGAHIVFSVEFLDSGRLLTFRFCRDLMSIFCSFCVSPVENRKKVVNQRKPPVKSR